MNTVTKVVPTAEELESIRKAFADLPKVTGVSVEMEVVTIVRVNVNLTRLEFADAKPVYKLEGQYYDKFPDVRFNVMVTTNS